MLIKTDAYDQKKAKSEMERYYSKYVTAESGKERDQQITKAVKAFLQKGKGGFQWITSDGC